MTSIAKGGAPGAIGANAGEVNEAEGKKRGQEELTMPDTAAIADEIRRLTTIDATQSELIAVVAHLANLFPDMTIADLSAAMQEAMAEAERQATRLR